MFLIILTFLTGDNVEQPRGASVSAASIITPPPSPPPLPTASSPAAEQSHHPPPISPPSSSYDPNLKCVRTVEDEEAAAIALALDKSIRRPNDVIPEQLIPTDDLTIVHVQPAVSE